MKRETLVVPAGIRYMSDWAEMEGGYRLEDYRFPHIVNKQITGCGFTEYCLRNNLNIVLCSPRKILLENKEDQHQGEVYYVKTTISGESLYDADLNSKRKIHKQENYEIAKVGGVEEGESTLAEMDNTKSAVLAMEIRIRDYYMRCEKEGRPCKILVTYDSFRHVREALSAETLESKFFIVIDEFQSIFTDSRFKSNTELEFMNYLQGLSKICFVSATPMLDRYLEMLDEFKDLPYYDLNWSKEDSSRVIHPRLVVRYCPSLISSANSIIEKYKSGDFEKYSYRDKDTDQIVEIESKEAVLYFNSVSNICDIIKRNNLTQEECNVLCATSIENETAIRKAFGVNKKNFQGISRVPKKGEQHKMFTLCTRTVYLGADFYSTCAQSFIFSDSNIDCLAVDISMDLPQILGRQRLESNPWKNSATIYFKPTDDRHVRTKEEFDKYLQNKLKSTNNLLIAFESAPEETKLDLANNYEAASKFLNYKKNYIAVNHHQAGKIPVPVFNTLVMVSEMRAFDIQQIDYKDRFSVFNSIKSEVGKGDSADNIILTSYADNLKHFSQFPDKLKYLCQLCEMLTEEEVSYILTQIPSPLDNYVRVLGPERCKMLSYRKVRVEEEYNKLVNNQRVSLDSIIFAEFDLGTGYSKPYIKQKLADIYTANNYKKTAKASDICNYFNTVSCDIFTEDGKRLCGFKLISKKEL